MAKEAERKIDLAAIQEELVAATTKLEEAEREESCARSAATSARNRVNQAQKALDEAMENLRKNAPRDSDWGSRRHRAQEVA